MAKKPVKPTERQTVKPASQKAVADTSGGSLASFKNILFNTPERAANNLLNVVKSTPLGIATQNAITGVNTFKEKGYKAAVTEQAKIAGVALATEAAGAGVGYVAGKVIKAGVTAAAPSVAKLLAKTNLSSELAPGQSLVLHFSDNPSLTTIKDIQKLRNKGGNFGSNFDSTKISPPGATYGYGPLDKFKTITEVQGAIEEAQTSKIRALIQGEKREYTLYAAKANPLGNSGGRRIKDPEYGFEKLSGDQGQSIFGKQKVLAKVNLKYDALDAATAKETALSKTASAYFENPEYQAAKQATIQTKQQMVDDAYNALVGSKKVQRAGAVPTNLQNPASAYAFETPAIPRAATPPIPTVTQTLQNMVKGAPKTGAAVGVVAANKKKLPKKR